METLIEINNGLEYKLLYINKNIGSFKFRDVIRKFQIVPFGNAEAAVNYEGIHFYSGSPECNYDEEIDGKMENPIIFNLNGESYVNLFKKHKEKR